MALGTILGWLMVAGVFAAYIHHVRVMRNFGASANPGGNADGGGFAGGDGCGDGGGGCGD